MSRGQPYGNSLFTERQYEVLRLRKEGMKPEQMAKHLGVTRQDISVLERRTRDNIEKAMNTLDLAHHMDVLHKFSIRDGMNILEASAAIFNEADRLGIKLQENYLSLAMMVRSAATSSIQKGRITMPLTAYIRNSGHITLFYDI